MQAESNHPHSPLQRQPHLYRQPGPSHGAAALRQQQTLPMRRHGLPPTQLSETAATAQLQQHQTGLWGERSQLLAKM